MKINNSAKVLKMITLFVILLTMSITVTITTVLLLNHFAPEAISDSLSVGIICTFSALAVGLANGYFLGRSITKLLGNFNTETSPSGRHASKSRFFSRKNRDSSEVNSIPETEDTITDENGDTVVELDAFDKLQFSEQLEAISTEC